MTVPAPPIDAPVMPIETDPIAEATRRQQVAIDRAASVWVAASAGTGKTKVLTDRVLNLMLGGTAPDRILCLTFTKAAAAEMANRINDLLSRWATVPDGELAQGLVALTGQMPGPAELVRARRLFASVLDTPGGMRIQTIHAFCQSMLRRFPLEAGVPAHFEVMDDRTALELLEAAQEAVLLAARNGDDRELSAALAEVTFHSSEQRFAELMEDLIRERSRLRRLVQRVGSFQGVIESLHALLDVPIGLTDAALTAETCREGAFDRAALAHTAAALLASKAATDQKFGRALDIWLAATDRVDCFEAYRTVFFTKSNDPVKRLLTKAVADASPIAADALLAEQNRLLATERRRRSLCAAVATAALLKLGLALFDAYERQKRARGLLDYDDLILQTRDLLHRPGVAPWVLYKLDGGIDHILIDEAQDTNPDQWEVVAALAEEFFAGIGTREVERTIFAVGDVKQSIFSFQRADPAAFLRMRDHFQSRAQAADQTWQSVPLETSFRSTDAVLRMVDAVFARAEAADGVDFDGGGIRHLVSRTGQGGGVELWPMVEPDASDDPEPWAPPVEQLRAVPPRTRLARALAASIRDWLDRGERLESRGRPIRPGDILVLVRRRNAFVTDFVRALKDLAVPVAGADRMVLTDQLAVRDLMALGRFLLMPEDDLTLATVLKGPLFGLSEDRLFDLAHRRGTLPLWVELRRRAGEAEDFAAAARELQQLLARADFAAPYELYADILAGRGGRRKILGRLGPEAADALDEFLAQTLAFERAHVPSLQGFLHWLHAGVVEAKRDMDAGGRDEVRVMTVHGSKGLQAPIVFLPDTLSAPIAAPRLHWTEDGGMVIWSPRRAAGEPVSARLLDAANRRRDQEYRRLLYVALTRAEDRLYVTGYRTRKAPPAGCWYNLVEAAFADLADAETMPVDLTALCRDGWSGVGRRLLSPQSAEPRRTMPVATAAGDAGGATPPEWVGRPPPREPTPPRPLAPSQPSHPEPSIRSPLGEDGGQRFKRGLIIHRLLQTLPDLPQDGQEAALRRYLARPVHDLDPEQQAEIARETLTVLRHPEFAPIFGPGSRAEVPVVGLFDGQVLSGRIDRILVTDRTVLIVDFKTNRPPPQTEDAVPQVYIDQLSAYMRALAEIFPGKAVRCALVWTDGPRLMPIERLVNDR